MDGLSQTQLFLMVALLWSQSQGLRLSPDRSEFLRWDSVDLDCENPDWILRRTTLRDRGTRCGQGWGQRQRATCSFRYIDPMDSGWYWCESKDGRIQGGRNITVTDTPLNPRSGVQNTPPQAETPPPVPETPPPASEALPQAPQRPLLVAVMCHLLVLCPYVASTVLLLSILRHRSSGNQDRSVTMVTSQTESGTDRRGDDIMAVTTEYDF